MSEETKKTMMKIENSEEAECTFVDDETSTDVDQEDSPKEYDEHSWPEEDPTGFTYKGKRKIFTKAVEKIKIAMKKGKQKLVHNVNFFVLDSRKVPHGTEVDVEISKENDRGQAVLKIC